MKAAICTLPALAALALAQTQSGISWYYSTDCTGEVDTVFGAPERGLDTCMGDLYSPRSILTVGDYPGYTVDTYSDSFCVDHVQTIQLGGFNGKCQTIDANARAYEIHSG